MLPWRCRSHPPAPRLASRSTDHLGRSVLPIDVVPLVGWAQLEARLLHHGCSCLDANADRFLEGASIEACSISRYLPPAFHHHGHALGIGQAGTAAHLQATFSAACLAVHVAVARGWTERSRLCRTWASIRKASSSGASPLSISLDPDDISA